MTESPEQRNRRRNVEAVLLVVLVIFLLYGCTVVVKVEPQDPGQGQIAR